MGNYIFMELIPPSTCNICPVIQLDLLDNKKQAISEISFTQPTLFKGWRSALDYIFCSLFNKLAAKGVSVKEGAIQFTLMLGASSADNALVSPSIAPLEAATCV